MKATLSVFSILLFAILAIPAVEAGIIHVPNDYSTIQQGIDAASTGDTVLVDSGLYAENIFVTNLPVTLASTFLISGDTSAISGTIIDGQNAGTVLTIDAYGQFLVEVIGFTVVNGLGTGNWPGVHGGGIHTGQSGNVSIDHCRFHNNTTSGESNRGAGIYINSSYSRISNCIFHDNQSKFGPAVAVGNSTRETVIDSCEIFDNVCTATEPDNFSVISITYSTNITVSRCSIHHNNGSGVRNWGSAITRVVNCTISGNGGYGLYNSYYNSNLYVLNTISAFNVLGTLLNNEQYSPAALCKYSDMTGGTGMPWFGIGCIDIDPMFADTLGWDYSLLSGSPCIDAGDPESPLDPDGTCADMGAIWHITTGVENEIATIPERFMILENYPNPFNAATTIRYILSQPGEMELSIYNVQGQLVKSLYKGYREAGEFSLIWNANDYPSGIYFARLQTSGNSRSLKMVLIK